MDIDPDRLPNNQALLRNLRHRANDRPYHCPFDDHEVSTLATVFRQFRPAYDRDPCRFAAILYTDVVQQLASSKYTYDEAKRANFVADRIPATLPELELLLWRFSRCSDKLLTSWGERLCSFPPLERKLLNADESPAREGDHLFILPAISNCLFCADSRLVVRSTTSRAGGKAPGGYCWAYDLHLVALQYRRMLHNHSLDLRAYRPSVDDII